MDKTINVITTTELEELATEIVDHVFSSYDEDEEALVVHGERRNDTTEGSAADPIEDLGLSANELTTNRSAPFSLTEPEV
jgi:hypothetical protein